MSDTAIDWFCIPYTNLIQFRDYRCISPHVNWWRSAGPQLIRQRIHFCCRNEQILAMRILEGMYSPPKT